MRSEYDFTTAGPNPHARRLKERITIRLDAGALEWFRELAAETDIPYQTLINLYLVDCAKSGRTIDLSWRDQGGEGGAGEGADTGAIHATSSHPPPRVHERTRKGED
jgi:hypothetical protein